MTPFVMIAGSVVAAVWLLHVLFVAGMWAKHRYRSNALSRYWQAWAVSMFVLGLPLDIAFNLTFGTLMYAELPPIKTYRRSVTILGRTFRVPLPFPELTFTSRCKRHKSSSSWRGRLARWWCKQLEQVDPGHC